MLRNADTSSKGILPICQDTGTATVIGKKGQQVWTGVKDEEYLAKGIYKTYTEENLRYSQTAPLTMYDEGRYGHQSARADRSHGHRRDGVPVPLRYQRRRLGQQDLPLSGNQSAAESHESGEIPYRKDENTGDRRLPAVPSGLCHRRHLGRSLFEDGETGHHGLPRSSADHGQRRTGGLSAMWSWKRRCSQAAYKSGYGAQFGGKYFALDVRIVRLPRHGASCPVGMGVSCSADRNVKAKINRDGIWLEQLEREPGRLIPEEYRGKVASNVVKVDLNRPMKEILAQLTKYPVTTQLSLNRHHDRCAGHRPRKTQGTLG